MKFYIDIGHGETINGRADPGAVNGSLVEHQINIVVGNALAGRLREHGHEVKVEPGNLQINESASLANSWGAGACISCHENAGGGKRGEVLYNWRDGAVKLAGAIGNGLKAAGQTTVYLIRSKANSAGTAEYFGMLRIPKMPAVIIEPAFIDNAIDRQLVDTVEEQKRIGVCIADAIAAEYGSKQPQVVKIVSGQHILAGFLQAGKTWAPIKELSAVEGFNYIWKPAPQGIYIGAMFIPAIVVNGVGYAELRLIANVINAKVTWDAATMTALII